MKRRTVLVRMGIATLSVFLALELPARSIVANLRAQVATTPVLRAMMLTGDSAAPNWHGVNDYLLPDDYISDAVNYRDGYRVTTNQPAAYERTVWIIGPSNVSSNDLADTETIPSQLQALIPTMRIVNVGTDGASTALLAERVKALPITTGDIVVLLAGAVESYAIFDRVTALRGTRLTDGLCSVLTYYSKLSFVTVACWSSRFDDSPVWSDDRFVDAATDQYEAYKRSVGRIKHTVSERGAVFINVIAPFCRCAWLEDYHGMERSFEGFAILARTDGDTLDYSHLVPPEGFYTFAHVNAVGAKQVAQILHKSIMGVSAQ